MLKDPVPTLFIQDEMHLVKESLGTFDAHYESFANYYAKNLVPEEQRKQIRFIGATATISMYQQHINHLYHMTGRRFPCEYPSMKNGEDFYSYTNMNDVTRILLGYAPYGRSITDGMWESVYLMRTILYSLIDDIDGTFENLKKLGFDDSKEKLSDMLYDYWIELVYNNRKDDVGDLANALQNQGNNHLEEKGIPKFNIEQMTSDVDFQTVRKTLFDIQSNRGELESTNILLATSTISHGVDEDSFNIMYFFGMPNNNAEYIQAYSRTGRKYTGIVIDIIRLMRQRDRSYLKNFVVFHQNKDDLVEAVPINRWAKNAIYSTLPGLLAALLMQHYTVDAENVKGDEISMFGEIEANPETIVTKYVFALLHSMAHAFIRTAGEISGLSGNSLTEIVIAETASVFVYAQTTQAVPLGALSGMAENNYYQFLNKVFDETRSCVFDPICTDRDDTSCSACMIIPEISCNHFNNELGRKYLYTIGTPEKEMSANVTGPKVNNPLIGFWEM